MKIMTVQLTGTKELLMHNERLANPIDPIVQRMKQVTSIRKKTDADHRQIAEIEFEGGLYFEQTIGPYIPDRVLRGVLIAAAKKLRLGQVVAESVNIVDPMTRLEYEGPRTVSGLWQKGFYDQRMVGNQKARVLRTRPKFPAGWKVTALIQFDNETLDQRNLDAVITRAQTIGIGDFRPMYGTFSHKVISVASVDMRAAA